MNAKEEIEAIKNFLSAQFYAEMRGYDEFICPLCGGKAVWRRAKSNKHLHAGCTDCGFKVME